jgi:AcrR family transcriptional regulator
MGIQERKQKTKLRILEAAEQLFQTQGFAKTTMNDVAKVADVGVGTLYNYYPSKTDLLIAIFGEKVEEVPLEQLLSQSPTLSVTLQLKQLTEHLIRRFIQHDRALLRESIALAIGLNGDATAIAKGTIHLDAQMMKILQSIIEQGIRSGEFPPDYDAGLAVQMIHANAVALVLNYLMDEQMSIDEVIEQMSRRIDFLLLRQKKG